MKTKLFIILTTLLFVVNGLTAQNRQQVSPEERANRQTEALTKRLDLNEEQKQKVYDIVLKYSKQRSSQRDSDMSREKRMEEFQKIQQQEAEEIKAVLTEEQQKEYDKYQKESRDRRNSNRRQR